MKIGIDARMYGPKQAGLGRYIEQLILHLEKIDQENQYILFVRDKIEIENDNFKIVIADIPWYSWEEQIKLSRIIKREKIDLMHFPHFNVPLFYSDPFVVTIHDLIMYHYPRPEATTLGPIKFWLKDKIHRWVVKHAVKKAKQIIAVSEFTRGDIHETLDIPLEKISVVYEGIIKVESIKYKVESVLEKYNIKKPYVLYVGNAYPHKNLEGLLKAWRIFKEKPGNDYQLVLAGRDSYFYEKLKNTSTHQHINTCVFTGFVEDGDLAELYKNASLYVFPSLYEGFGLPPLEAMSYGVPVVSSNRSCLPEILGEGVLYFDPENYQQMAEVIHTSLTDADARFDLKQKAREELKRYSWEKMARETLDIYKKYAH